MKRKEKEECLDLVANYTSGSDTEEPVKIISSDSELQNPSKKVKKTVKMVLCNSPAEKGKYEQARENNIKEFNTQYQALFGKPVVQMKTCPKCKRKYKPLATSQAKCLSCEDKAAHFNIRNNL